MAGAASQRTCSISRVSRGTEPMKHNHEDERNGKNAKVTINDCDKKMGSPEETMGGDDTVEPRRVGP